MTEKQLKLKKMLVAFVALFVVAVLFFIYDYYSPSNLNSFGEELVVFQRSEDGRTVRLESDYDIPVITSIRYTLDGSLPTKDSEKYTEPLVIENEGRNGTVIRAAVFRGGKSSKVYTKTFFTGRSSLNDGIYTVCISTDRDNLYSDEKGIFVLGAATQEEANANENIPYDARTNNRANYFGRGIEWERPATVEIYSSNGEEILTKEVGVRVTGANSRAFPVKSLRLYARKAYDGKGTFEMDIFDQYTAQLGNKVTTYNHLDLRMGGNNFYYTLLPDTIMRQVAYDSGFDAVGTAVPAVVYINGEYYTLVWMQPDYCGRNYAEMAGLDNNSFVRAVKGFEGSATDGTMEGYLDYMEMYEFASTADFTIPEEREKLEKILDVDNCLMYYFLEMYCDNNDWPTNNYGLWRCVDPAKSDPENKYADGRWRYMFYDLDNAFSSYADHTEGFDFVLGVKISPMFVNLMRSKEYVQRFINIVCDLMNTTTKYENVYDTYIRMKDLIEPEMQWRFENSAPIDFDEAHIAITHFRMVYHMETKQGIIDQRLRDYFGARQKYNLSISSVPENVTIKLNTLEFVHGDEFDGVYYKDAPAVLSYRAADGYTLDYWLINGVKYYDEQLILDSNVAGAGDCNIEICVKKTASDAAIHSLVWGGIARYIDVYNPGTEEVSLAEYSVSSDIYGHEKYTLPDSILKSGESFRVYFTDDKSASRGDYICGINVKEGTTVYLLKNGEETDRVYVPEYIDGYILEKSGYDGSWKYVMAKEGSL